MEGYVWFLVCSALAAQVALILWFEYTAKRHMSRLSVLYADSKNRERITYQYLEQALQYMPMDKSRALLVRLSDELMPHHSTSEQDDC